MSSQDYWPCLTVQQFLRLCNWKGQQLESQKYWQQQALSFKTSWKCLTVEEFFSHGNWEGRVEAGDQGSTGVGEKEEFLFAAPLPTHSQTAWKCLTVQEFFSQFNWQGRAPETISDLQNLDPYYRLKQQVREFFQFMPWEGTPAIATLPKSAAPLPKPAVAEPTLTDLSDLF